MLLTKAVDKAVQEDEMVILALIFYVLMIIMVATGLLLAWAGFLMGMMDWSEKK